MWNIDGGFLNGDGGLFSPMQLLSFTYGYGKVGFTDVMGTSDVRGLDFANNLHGAGFIVKIRIYF